MTEDHTSFAPSIPEVDNWPDIEVVFTNAREKAAGTRLENGVSRRQLVIVTPGRLLITKTCPLFSEFPKAEVLRLTELIPQTPSINIAVIALTYLEALKSNILKAIPFYNYLQGFAALGHSVWIFEGHSNALTAGCRDADLLVVDGGLLPFL